MNVFEEKKPPMKKPMRIMLIGVGILFIFVFGYKLVKNMLMNHYMAAHQSHVVYVSAMEARLSNWQTIYKASGSLRAVVGVNVTTELPGMIKTIYFTPGAMVKKDDLLVLLDIDADVAQLHSLEANANYAKITYIRDKAQYAIAAISKATLDSDEANFKSSEALVEHQKALIAQKTIRAPFSGRLGISMVNPGQYLNPGDKITMLQTLDPIYVDFYIPQQSIHAIGVNQIVTMTVDALPGKSFMGKVTTIDPGVDPAVRNVQVEATIPNPDLLLVPGMFASVTVDTGQSERYITLPQAAITFNPYGETVYIIKEKGKDKNGNPKLIVNETFVTTGEKRGDQVSIQQGVKVGDKVVTSGQLKLNNGSMVAINNSIMPTNAENPKPMDQ